MIEIQQKLAIHLRFENWCENIFEARQLASSVQARQLLDLYQNRIKMYEN